jgi:hypothetical protein
MECLFEFPELHEVCPYNTCIRENCPTIQKFLELCKMRTDICHGTGILMQEVDGPYCSFGFCIGSDVCPKHFSNKAGRKHLNKCRFNK